MICMMTVSIFMNTYLVPGVPTDFAFEAWKEKVVHEAAGDDDDGQQRHVVVEKFNERQSQRACVRRINSYSERGYKKRATNQSKC